MKILIKIVILFLMTTCTINGQDMCIKIDSIECYFIPWKAKTTYNVGIGELVSGKTLKKYWFQKKVREKEILTFFLDGIKNQEKEYIEKMVDDSDIDARMLLVIKYENGTSEHIVFNQFVQYLFRGTLYKPSKKILIWLNEYIAQEDGCILLSEEVANKFKREENYLLHSLKENGIQPRE